MTDYNIVRDCTQHGCASHSYFREDCRTCGFFKKEAQRRKELPLVEDEDGISRKIIRRTKDEL